MPHILRVNWAEMARDRPR